MTDPDPIPATDDQIARALAQADGVLAAAGHRLAPPGDRIASDAAITAAMRGAITFDEAVAAGLARITGKGHT